MPDPTPAPRRRRLGCLAGLAALAAAAGGVAWVAGGRGTADRADGLALAGAGDFAAAEPPLARAYGRNPADAEVAEALARGYAGADDPKAGPLLDRWVELAPDRPAAVRARMEYLHKRRDPRAYPDARRLAELDPADAKARRAAMNLAFSYGHFADAEARCRDELRRQPGDPDARRLLAQALRAQGNAAGAAAVLDDLIRENPRASGPLLARADLHLAAGEPDRAVPLLTAVFDADPQQRRAAGYQLAMALGQTGRAAEADRVRAEVERLQAVSIARDAIDSRPADDGLRVELAERLLAAGHTADGLALLADALARNPRLPAAHRALAAHYEKAGDAARAATHRRLAGP